MTTPDVCFIVSTPMFYTPDDPQKQWPLFGLLLLNSMKRYLTGSYKVIAVETQEEESIVDLKAYCESLGPNFQYERVSHPFMDYPICAKIEAMKKAVKAEKAVVLIDVDAGWFGHMDVSWFDLGMDYDVASFPGLNVSRTFPFTGKDWDFLRKSIDNPGRGAPRNPKELGNCGTHITILNPRFVNIQSFVDRWLASTIKMYKAYPNRVVDNAAFTILTEKHRIKWVERDLHNCTFDYVNMGILLVRFPKLMALAQKLYATDRVFQETVDKSPHRGTIVKRMLEVNVGPVVASPHDTALRVQKRELYRLPSAQSSFRSGLSSGYKKYYYYPNPLNRIMSFARALRASTTTPARAATPTPRTRTTSKQIQALETITNPHAKRDPQTIDRSTPRASQSTTVTPRRVSHRIQAIYDKLRANNMKKITSLGNTTQFYPEKSTGVFGRFY